MINAYESCIRKQRSHTKYLSFPKLEKSKENPKEVGRTKKITKKSVKQKTGREVKFLVKLLKKRRENKIPNNRNERGLTTTDSINTSIILREFDKHVMPPNLTN